MRNLPIIALDFKSKEELNTFLDQFNEPLCVKIGMELFYQTGPVLIKSIKDRG
ncbi:orotidine 5'-phosphate decarboxylase / HUMPS family protein, partial [Staphylococcus saccharolyticus]